MSWCPSHNRRLAKPTWRVVLSRDEKKSNSCMNKRWIKILVVFRRKSLNEEQKRLSKTNAIKLLISNTWQEQIIFRTILTLSRQLRIAKLQPTLHLTVTWCVTILIIIMASHMASSIPQLILTGQVALSNSSSTIQTASIRRCRKLQRRLQPQPIINTITIHRITCTLKWALKLLHQDINIVLDIILVKK